MKTIQIGRSGIASTVLHLGAFAIGGGVLWGDSDEQESIRTIHAALDAGINTIDTAPIYNFGASEEVVGKALKGRREKVILSTKVGLRWDTDEGTHFASRDGREIYRNLSAGSIKYEVEQSLRRLQTDYIDIYITHWQSIPPFAVPIAETMGALCELKAEGKIRAIGISNITPQQVQEYQKYGQVDLMQEKYSILDRGAEDALLPLCEREKITFQAYQPLEKGLLTGRFGRDYKPEGDAANSRRGYYMMRDENRLPIVEMLEGWGDLCKKYDCALADLAVAWLTAQSGQVAVICGSRKPAQIAENARAADIRLEAADMARMRMDAEKVTQKFVK